MNFRLKCACETFLSSALPAPSLTRHPNFGAEFRLPPHGSQVQCAKVKPPHGEGHRERDLCPRSLEPIYA